jgi:hypothetical protein
MEVDEKEREYRREQRPSLGTERQAVRREKSEMNLTIGKSQRQESEVSEISQPLELLINSCRLDWILLGA